MVNLEFLMELEKKEIDLWVSQTQDRVIEDTVLYTKTGTFEDSGERADEGEIINEERLDIKFDNSNSLKPGEEIEYVYNLKNSNNEVNYYGTYNQSQELKFYMPLGLSLVFFILTFYMFHISCRLYDKLIPDDDYTGKRNFDFIFYLSPILIIMGWCFLVMEKKDLPSEFLLREILHFPDQFFLGVFFSNVLLVGGTLFRFITVIVLHSPDQIGVRKLKIAAFIGALLNVINLTASLVTLYVFLSTQY